jgi:hypothetical protein
MPPKLKSAAALPPKKKFPPKEPGVENLTTALSKSKLKGFDELEVGEDSNGNDDDDEEMVEDVRS